MIYLLCNNTSPQNKKKLAVLLMRPKYYVFIFAESDYGVYQSFYEKKNSKSLIFMGFLWNVFDSKKPLKKPMKTSFFVFFSYNS